MRAALLLPWATSTVSTSATVPSLRAQWSGQRPTALPRVFTFKLPADSKMKGRRLLSTEDKHALIASLGVEYYLCPRV